MVVRITTASTPRPCTLACVFLLFLPSEGEWSVTLLSFFMFAATSFPVREMRSNTLDWFLPLWLVVRLHNATLSAF